MDINNIISFTTNDLKEKGFAYDKETYNHSMRVAKKTKKIIESLYDLEDMDTLSILLGTFLHDVGKILTPKEILQKPDKLTAEEFDVIKLHPKNGVKILKNTRLLDDIENAFGIKLDKFLIQSIVLYHHENLKGEGYYGIYNTNSIINIVSMVDVFCALTEPRSYKRKWDKEYAISVIKKMEYVHPTMESVCISL